MSDLSLLPNIGKVLEERLESAGIFSARELKEVGSEKAFLRFYSIAPDDCCLHMLLALEGAVQGVLKKELPQGRKEELKLFFNQLKRLSR